MLITIIYPNTLYTCIELEPCILQISIIINANQKKVEMRLMPSITFKEFKNNYSIYIRLNYCLFLH